MAETYAKRTVAANTIPIPIPPQFRLDDRIEFRERFQEGGYRDRVIRLFYISSTVVEGVDGKNSKLVIKHKPTKTNEETIVVPLGGRWDEMEKPDLETKFEFNFFAGGQYSGDIEMKLNAVIQEYIKYIDHYFHYDPVGKSIMETIRKRAKIEYEKIEKQEEKLHKLPKVAEALKFISSKCIDLFMDQKEEPYVLVDVDDHTEVMSLDEPRFAKWIRRVYIDHKLVESEDNNPQDLLSSEDVTNIVNNLKANRAFDYNTKTLYLRVAFDPNKQDTIYYDLTNPDREAIKITPEGWTVEKYPPALFIREKGCIAQVKPAASQSYDPKIFEWFMNLINLKVSKDDAESENLTEEERKLLFTCYVISLFWGDPKIARAVLMVHGPEGSAKTFCQRLIKLLVDPAAIETMPFPKWNQNLLVQQMANTYLPFFDNVEILDAETSNAVCRASTGDGFKVRKLWTTNEDYIFKFTRSVGFNGLNLAATRPDLLSRGFIIRLAAIDENNRREEKEIWKEFEEIKPQLLAYIFDVLSNTLKIYKENSYNFVKIEKLPRMASFVALCETISRAMSNPNNAFVEAYKKNTKTQTDAAIESDPIADYIIKMIADGEDKEGPRYKFVGYYTQLLRKLEEIAIEEGGDNMINLLRQKYGGNNNSALSRKLQGLENTLKARGIKKTERPHPKTRRKEVTIQRDPFYPFMPSQSENQAQNQLESAKGYTKGSEGDPKEEPFADTSSKTASFDLTGSNQGDNFDAKGSKGSKGIIRNSDISEVSDSMISPEILQKAMRDNQGLDKGYFTKDDFAFTLIMLPNEHWTEDQAEQTLYALVDEGKLQEIETGKYKPSSNQQQQPKSR